MYVSQSAQNTIIPLVASALFQNGAAAYTRVAAPDDYDMGWSISDYNSYASDTKADLGQWNSHAYSANDSERSTAYSTIGQTDHKRSELGICSRCVRGPSEPISNGLIPSY